MRTMSFLLLGAMLASAPALADGPGNGQGTEGGGGGPKTGPDPPAGNYAIGIRLNVENPPNPNVPYGEPLVYPEPVVGPGGQVVWGLTVHGWVDLPAPNPGGPSSWAVGHSGTWEATLGGQTSAPSESFGPVAWNGAVNKGHWAMTVVPGWDFVYGFGAGSYESHFSLYVNSPGTGGWFYEVSCRAFWVW